MRAIDKIINVKVRGDHLTKDNRNAGVQHEANVTFLRIDFDEGWDPYAKTVTFWDALMGNPTKLVMSTDKLENIQESHRIYLVPIPGEALGEPGDLTFVVDGWTDGKRKRSLADTLYVKPAPFEEEADEPTDPTPSQAEQMQVQLDLIISDIQKAEIAASEAQSNADFALLQARTAGENAQDAMNQAIAAGNHRRAAEAAQTAAETAQTAAAASAAAAKTSETNAAKSATTATTGATTATTKASEAAASASTATTKASEAATSATSAASSASSAATNKTAAQTAANNAASSATKAAASEAAAESSAAAAAKSAAEAAEIAGGDFATNEALRTHNTSDEAHDGAVARAKTGGEIDTRLQNRVEKSGDTMTGILTFDTPGLFSAFQKKRTIGGVNYLMRAGIGNDGNGASVCLRLFSVAADGTETVVSHIEADSSGVYWVSPGGIRKTIAHSGNIGVLTASVE